MIYFILILTSFIGMISIPMALFQEKMSELFYHIFPTIVLRATTPRKLRVYRVFQTRFTLKNL